MDTMKCIRLKHKLVDNLNIVYNVTSSTIVFWNKYQILLFDELKYENLTNGGQLMYISEFYVAHVILLSNYLICLDYSGNIHMMPLKFKQTVQKRVKSSFQKREEGILCIVSNDDVTYCLKKQEKYLYLCVHNSSDFQILKKILILYDKIHGLTSISPRKKPIFCSRSLSETEFVCIQEIFKTNDPWDNQIVVIVSWDHITLYAFLVGAKILPKGLTPIKLFTSPSQISDINFTHESCLNIILSLATGTLFKLSLNNQYKTPEVVHLNTAIHKLIAFNDTVIYTDGISMWKGENTFSEVNASFKQFKVKHVKDFIKVSDRIICTTYAKLTYLLLIDDEYSYIEPPTTSDYCPTEHVLNNSDYLYKIMEEVEKNNRLIDNIKKEENHLTTLALCNRCDIMDEMIQYKIIVYENYEDILREGVPLKLADRLKEYFNVNTIYFLVKITTTLHLQQKFSDILSNIFGNLKIHITLVSEKKVLKTTSIKVMEQLKNLNIVLALSTQMNLTNVTVHIRLVTNIPGALNEMETLWTALHCKNIELTPEHFIKTNLTPSNLQFLKEPTKSVINSIFESTCNLHGQLFKISRISNTNNPITWPFYVKLPKNYQEALRNKTLLVQNFNTNKINYLFNEISSEEFLKSRINLCFIISKERVEIEIVNDGISNPLLKVTSHNPEVGLGIRNFFSNLVNNNFNIYETEFVNNALYESVENIEKKMKLCMLKQSATDDFLHLFEQYQKNIISVLLL